jgi:hypothetical protein
MSRSDRSAGILVEIRQGGRLLAALPLGVDPIEVTLRDIRSGLPLGTLSAKGPAPGKIDEPPMPRPVRPPDDDITMPLPERTYSSYRRRPELTGDLDGDEPETETAEAQRPGPYLDRQVPNLARSTRSAVTDESTSPAMPRATPMARHDSDALAVAPSTGLRPPKAPEHTLSSHLTPVETSEETISSLLQYVDLPAAIPPAEVWTRTASEWRSAGRLNPGQAARERQGWVRLETDGRLMVNPGPELSGTATMADGTTLEIRKGGEKIRLPAGSSVILRGTGHGLYVRTDPPLPSH